MATPNRPLSQNKYTEQNMGNTSFDEEFSVNAVENLGYDGTQLQRKFADALLYKFDYNGGTNPVYIGVAAPGTATSTQKWLIKKLTFDGSDNVTDIQYPSGSPNFNQAWDDRAGLSYS
jgi:hypothetical protein